MTKITIVGSGATGVHFALSALKRGFDVTMIDVGYTGPEAVNPEQSFNQLKCRLKDPVKYFLGESFESVVPPYLKHRTNSRSNPPVSSRCFPLPPVDWHRHGLEALILLMIMTWRIFPLNIKISNHITPKYPNG